ncbi:hypothetical protein V757_07170 [Pelistega indica]|uniref:Lysine exporter LysO family protein n=1 Tax=Pelistega indica TaxID=1414851 RepID=V8G2T4_9BURK|nr:lysine exporter LysO family protein [Pelistega indica]ETD70750.1 hypothetical protein V757_07170 [Pelistega indica]
MDTLTSLLPICLAIVVGMMAGHFLPATITQRIARSITPFIWILLFAIGYKFGLALENITHVTDILTLASVYSIGLSIFVALILYLLYGRKTRLTAHKSAHDLGIAHVLKECALAFLSIILGGLFAQSLLHFSLRTDFMPSSEVFLYILLFIIGVDLINAPVSLKSINRRIVFMPVWILIASTIGSVFLSWLMGIDYRYGLVLSGGHGWFSLSAVLVTAHLGEFYGATASLTDLFRELLSIVALFFIGARYPDSAIAVAGATAMDTTLPIIKKTAGNQYIAQAIYVGVALSVIAPFWLGFLISLIP